MWTPREEREKRTGHHHNSYYPGAAIYNAKGPSFQQHASTASPTPTAPAPSDDGLLAQLLVYDTVCEWHPLLKQHRALRVSLPPPPSTEFYSGKLYDGRPSREREKRAHGVWLKVRVPDAANSASSRP